MNETSAGVRRVLMTADTVGGVWTYALDLARALSTRGIQVALATMGAPVGRWQREQARHVPGLQLHESTFKLEWMDDPWTDVRRAGDWLLTLENNLKPEVVHLNGYVHAALPWRAPCVVVAHSCVLTWWAAVKREPAPASWITYRDAVSCGLRAATFVIAPSQAALAELQRCYGHLPATGVIPNGRYPAGFLIERKQPVVLSAGRIWDEAKNIALLGDVQPLVRWPIEVAGDDSHPGGGRRPARNVRLLGRLSETELARHYARAAIYCLPARYEPFGLSVLEAALSGCALVLGDIPSLRENWNGIAQFADPDDAPRFAKILESLIADNHRRQSLAAAAFERAKQFTPSRMADGYVAIYNDAVARPMLATPAGRFTCAS